MSALPPVRHLLLALSLGAAAVACSSSGAPAPDAPRVGYAASAVSSPRLEGGTWVVDAMGVASDAAEAERLAREAGLGELLQMREVRVQDRVETLTRWGRGATGPDGGDRVELLRRTLLTSSGTLRGARVLSTGRDQRAVADGVQVTLSVAVDDLSLFPERRLQQVFDSVPEGRRAGPLVDLARAYGLADEPGLAFLALDSALAEPGADPGALLDAADLLAQLGERALALQLNARLAEGLPPGTALASRAVEQRARLLAATPDLPEALSALERLSLDTRRPGVLDLHGADGDLRLAGAATRTLTLETPSSAGRLLLLWIDARGLTVELPDEPVTRRKQLLAAGLEPEVSATTALIWLLPEDAPALAIARDLGAASLPRDADADQRMRVADLLTSLRGETHRPDVGAQVLRLRR